MTAPFAALVAGDVEPGRYRLTDPLSLNSLREELVEAGWTVRNLDGAVIGDRAALLDEFARACGFPHWFGANWDALADCLGDLSWLPAAPVAIFWVRSHSFEQGDPSDWATVGRVIDTAIAFRIAAGLPPLYVIYPTHPTDADPVGGDRVSGDRVGGDRVGGDPVSGASGDSASLSGGGQPVLRRVR